MTRLTPALPLGTIRPRGRIVSFAINQKFPPPHEFQAAFVPDEDGGFAVFAVNYPSVMSQGDTLDEARNNIAEAFLAVLESRKKHGETMTFSYQPVEDVPKDCRREWVVING
jgi:predicted RNase H-like HicB family nuclease